MEFEILYAWRWAAPIEVDKHNQPHHNKYTRIRSSIGK